MKCGLTAGLVLLLACGLAQAQRDPLALMRAVQQEDVAPDEIAEFTMELIDSSGRVRTRTGTLYERQVRPGALEEARLIRFHSPSDFRGSGVLTIEYADRDNDQWIYLPAYHTARRIAPANRASRYMGTDFLYEDLMRRKLEAYRYAIVGEETLDGTRCVQIEDVPVAEDLRRETAYSRTVSWMDPTRAVVLRVDYYDRDKQLFKRLTFRGIERVAGKHRAQEVRMEELVLHHVTIVRYHGRRIGTGVPASYFTERYLKRGL